MVANPSGEVVQGPQVDQAAITGLGSFLTAATEEELRAMVEQRKSGNTGDRSTRENPTEHVLTGTPGRVDLGQLVQVPIPCSRRPS